MAVGDSIIRVSIIGDVKKLSGAIGTANKQTGGLLTSLAKVSLAAGAIRGVVGFGGEALENADRFNDALTDISGTLSPDFARRISDISDDFHDIGLSAPEVAEMAAAFANLATAAKVTAPAILEATPQILELASAIAAITGKDPGQVIDDIGKAAGGATKPMKDYGVVVDKALNPDDRLTDIIRQLTEKYPDAKSAADDFAGSQDELNAKWETFTTKVGLGLEGPLTSLLDWLNDMVDGVPSAIQGWQMLGKVIEDVARTVLGPLGNVRDVLEQIHRLTNITSGLSAVSVPSSFGHRSEEKTNNDVRDRDTRNGIVNRRIGGP